MKRTYGGLSLVELIVVLAMVGILTGIGLTQFNYGGFATQQAAQVAASSVNRARLEAIRSNETVGIEFVDDGTSGFVRLCSDIDLAASPLSCPTTESATIERINFGDGDLARARFSLAETVSVFFDRRGVMRNPGNRSVLITDRAGGNRRTLSILATGRTVIE